MEDTTSHAASPADKVGVDQCRMYEAEYPEPGELVMVRVIDIRPDEPFYPVALVEYNDKEGIVLLGEPSGRRLSKSTIAPRVGKEEVARVIRVDKEKGYIDLSRRRLSEQDMVECSKRYRKSKAVHSIMMHAAELHREHNNSDTLEQLYRSVGWPLYAKYGHAYDAFEKAAAGEEDIFEGIADTPADTKHLILQAIQRNPQPRPSA